MLGLFSVHQEDKFAILRPGDRLGLRGQRLAFRVGDCESLLGCIAHFLDPFLSFLSTISKSASTTSSALPAPAWGGGVWVSGAPSGAPCPGPALVALAAACL